LYNPSESHTQAIIALPFLPKKIELVGLDELSRPHASADVVPLLEKDGGVRIALAPKKIITLRIEPA
jgi:hypothetical protein